MRRARPLTVLVCAVLAARLFAIPLPLEYHARMWTVADGLPYNNVSRTLQDSSGFLWFATLGGLARFDGRVFREMNPPAVYRPLGLNIRSLAEEKPGTLLVVPTGPVVLRLSGSEWSVHPVTTLLTTLNDAADEVVVDVNGHAWVTTMERRLLRSFPDGTSELVFDALPSARAPRFTFARDPKGEIWLATDSAFGALRNGKLEPLESAPREPIRVQAGRNGRIWLSTAQRLFCLENGRLTVKVEQELWSEAGPIRELFEDSRGRLWISNRRGLFCYANGRIDPAPLSSPHVRHITEDFEGNLWAATEGHGVAQLREKAHRILGRAMGLQHEVVSSVAEAPDGTIWLANRPGGLVPIARDGTMTIAARAAPLQSYANAVSVDAKNQVWFAGARNGLWRWTPGADSATEMLPPPYPRIRLLHRARNGDIWFVGYAGTMGVFRGDVLHPVPAAVGLLAEDIRAITQDHAGDVWFAGRTGTIVRWDGQRAEQFTAEHGLPASPIHSITVDADNRLWIGTTAGLVLKDGARFHTFTEADGLADSLLEQVLEDNHEHLWFSARRGFFFVAKSELLAVARSGGRVTSHLIGRSQGLANVQTIQNYSPAACKSRDGQLWFATGEGALVIDPQQLPRNLPPPPVFIDEIRIDGRPTAHAGRLRINPGARRVEFRLSVPAFTAPENVLLRHRLDGVDRDWIDTGVERTATYMNLRPGNYRLQAIARNSAGGWNNEGATLAFTVVPAWWERWYFQVGVSVLLLGLTAWLARTFVQRRLESKLRRLEQEHALEKERTRIARDLHDDLGGSLTAVGLLADRLVKAAPPELTPQLSGLASLTKRLATDLSGIVWTMGASNSSLDRLAEFLRRYGERLFRNTGVNCVTHGVEKIPPVPLAPDPQHQLLAAAKEALTNILKHGRATEARIDLSYAGEVFEIRIVDNGTGFELDATAQRRGNGLRNMRSRLEEIGGSYQIVSAPGRGTQVILRFPTSRP